MLLILATTLTSIPPASPVILNSAAVAQQSASPGILVYQKMVPPGIQMSLYLRDKHEVRPGVYKFKTTVKYEGSSPRPASDWRLADCNSGTIDGKTVKAIPSATVEDGMAELIRRICLH